MSFRRRLLTWSQADRPPKQRWRRRCPYLRMPGRIAPDRLYAGSWWGRVKAGATPYPSFAFNERVPRQMLCQPRHISSTENTAFSIFCDLRTKSAKSTGSERIGARRAIFGLFPARPVNRSSPKTPGILPKSGGIGRGESECVVRNGVPYGIRTRAANVKGWCPRPLDERDKAKRSRSLAPVERRA